MATAESQPSSSGRTAPETDAAERMAFAGEYMVPTEVARKLERERDEAREKYFAMRELSNNATELAEKYKRERDEAREEIEHMKSLLLDPHAVHINFLHGKIAKLDWEKLEHIHGPHLARKERDEARAWVSEIFRLLDLPEGDMGALENFIRQRDELLGVKKEPKWYNGREIPIATEEAAK